MGLATAVSNAGRSAALPLPWFGWLKTATGAFPNGCGFAATLAITNYRGHRRGRAVSIIPAVPRARERRRASVSCSLRPTGNSPLPGLACLCGTGGLKRLPPYFEGHRDVADLMTKPAQPWPLASRLERFEAYTRSRLARVRLVTVANFAEVILVRRFW